MIIQHDTTVTCGQIWWPILGICALHLNHPSEHTHSSEKWTNTHTMNGEQPYCCSAREAVVGLVLCSRVSHPSCYLRWKRVLLFTPPTKTRTHDLWVTSPTLKPLGHGCPSHNITRFIFSCHLSINQYVYYLSVKVTRTKHLRRLILLL